MIPLQPSLRRVVERKARPRCLPLKGLETLRRAFVEVRRARDSIVMPLKDYGTETAISFRGQLKICPFDCRSSLAMAFLATDPQMIHCFRKAKGAQ